MFGFSPIAAAPFASVIRVGTPALAYITGAQLASYLENVDSEAKARVNISGIEAFLEQAYVDNEFAYLIGGIPISVGQGSLRGGVITNVFLDQQPAITVEQAILKTALSLLLSGQQIGSVQNTLSPQADANTDVSAQLITSALNSVFGKANATGSVTGVSALFLLNSLAVTGKASVTLDSQRLQALLKSVLVWSDIPVPPSGPWVVVPDDQLVSWEAISDDQLSNWITVNDANAIDWEEVDDSEDPDWTEVPN